MIRYPHQTTGVEMVEQRLSVTETAKLIRAALKKDFPKVKFSVRSSSYSGGSSITVRWVDGPTTKMVERITNQFRGANFDGMIDLKVHQSHWLLPDGTTVVANNPGTVGSLGTIQAQENPKPHPNARLVSFGADYVFCNRDRSPEFEKRVLERLANKGIEEAKGVASFNDASRIWVESHGQYLSTLGHIEAEKVAL